MKMMYVRDSQNIQIVTPDDHVKCGFYEILLLAADPLTLMTRYLHNLERKRKECKERFGCHNVYNRGTVNIVASIF